MTIYRIMQYLMKRGLTRSQANSVHRMIDELIREERKECAALLERTRDGWYKARRPV